MMKELKNEVNVDTVNSGIVGEADSKDNKTNMADKVDKVDKENIGDKNMVRDSIGELVDLNKCPICTAHTDCFGNIGGRCTALNVAGGRGCAFYKNRDQALAENRAAFRYMMQNRRYDLISKYGKQLAAIGAMDDEAMDDSIEGGCNLDAFAEADYQRQLEEMVNKIELSKIELTKKAGDDV